MSEAIAEAEQHLFAPKNIVQPIVENERARENDIAAEVQGPAAVQP